MKFTEENGEKALEMYLGGVPIHDIGKKFSLAQRENVYYLIKQANKGPITLEQRIERLRNMATYKEEK